jgi:hypothetical protein
MDRTGQTDPDQLRQLTGLSKEQIGRYKLILSLPKRYQKLIDDQKIPMNFFVELERNVIKPLEESRKQLSREFSAAALRKAFVAKRESGAIPDVIDFRKVRPIIERAELDAGSPDQSSALDDALRHLFSEATTTVDEAYEASIAFTVESEELAERAEQIREAFETILAKASSDSERDSILDELRGLRDSLSKLLARHE